MIHEGALKLVNKIPVSGIKIFLAIRNTLFAAYAECCGNS
jgi:hypothetical protein